MNLVEFIVCLVYVPVCGAVTLWGGAHFGAMGYVVGFLAGSVATLAVLMSIALAAIWLEKRISIGVPRYPPCKNGCCSVDDYRRVEESSSPILICRCGDRYDKRGKRFVRIDADGGEAPYMRWKPFGVWVADD